MDHLVKYYSSGTKFPQKINHRLKCISIFWVYLECFGVHICIKESYIYMTGLYIEHIQFQLKMAEKENEEEGGEGHTYLSTITSRMFLGHFFNSIYNIITIYSDKLQQKNNQTHKTITPYIMFTGPLDLA